MYAWKCWHDSRDRVILYAAASLAIGLMFGTEVWAQYHTWLPYISKMNSEGMRWGTRFGGRGIGDYT